jgi:hypothetical protein
VIIGRSSLLAAALAAAATPALAQDIPTIRMGDTCQKKVDQSSWHLCGRVPADGQIPYTNVGIHKLTVFTTGPEGVTCDPLDVAGEDIESLKTQCGALQIDEGLLANASSHMDVEQGQLVYIARDDQSLSSRTLAIKFTAGREYIQQGETCQQKVDANSWHQCGFVPADGRIAYTNIGIHKLTVFTTGPDGVTCEPAYWEIDGPDNATVLTDECGALQVQEGLLPNESSQMDVKKDQLVYIARDDDDMTSRTIAVSLTAVPPNAALAGASPFSDVRMLVEFNATTEDAGIRASLDGEPWDAVRIIGPDQRIFQASGGGNLGQLGLTDLAFESHAPTLEDLLTLFPEGEYELRGRTIEGDRLVGTATLTHDIPDEPQILTPAEGALVDPENAVISWDPVTEPAGIEIVGYRVLVERGDRGRSLSFDLPPEATSVPVPPDFLEAGTDYLFKVLAIEAGGNRTITEGIFDTAEGGLGAAAAIKMGDVCQKKIEAFSWHLCGSAPADGQISFKNTGPHEATIFTTGPEGVRCVDANCPSNILQVAQPDPVPISAVGQVAVSKGDLVYLERVDGELSERTLAIQFTAVP